MGRTLLGTLAVWIIGWAGLLAQSPGSTPYANYAQSGARGAYHDVPVYDESRRAPGPQYGPVNPPAQAPVLGPMYGPAYGPPPGYVPAYGPVMATGGMMPPAGGVPMMNGPMPDGRPGPMMTTPDGRPAGPMMMAADPRMSMIPNGCWNGACGAWGGYRTDNCDGCWNGDCNGCGNRCPCGPCGPDGRIWASAELLLWWTRGAGLPPLLTSGTGAANPGVIGQAGTAVIFGGEPIDRDMRVGVRTRLGFWLNECQMLGVEGSFFYLGQAVNDLQHCCAFGDVVSRPIFNADPTVNANDAELVCLPGVVTGSVAIRTTNEFYGADGNLRRCLVCNCVSRIDLVGGFRYMHLSDSVDITENLMNLDPLRGAVGEGFIVHDSFHSTNNFYGGQVGLAGEFRSGQIFVDWRALVGFGSTIRVIDIAGSTTFLDPTVPGGNPIVQPGGLLAQPSNIGRHTSNDFSIVPEVNINLGYAITPHIRAYVGYSFMYWTNVARAGEQINLNVDPQQLPSVNGPGVGVNPQFILHTTDFWAQGINFGVQLRY